MKTYWKAGKKEKVDTDVVKFYKQKPKIHVDSLNAMDWDPHDDSDEWDTEDEMGYMDYLAEIGELDSMEASDEDSTKRELRFLEGKGQSKHSG